MLLCPRKLLDFRINNLQIQTDSRQRSNNGVAGFP